jgi:hypothetical protein
MSPELDSDILIRGWPMRLHALIVVTATALLISGCILPIPHLDKEWDAIDGKVLDKATGLPVVGAEVSVTYDEGSPATTRTGSDGCFHFGTKYRFWPILYIGPRDCMYLCILSVKANGYADGHLESHSFVTPQLVLEPGKQPDVTYEDGLLIFRLIGSPHEPPEKTSPD